MDSRKSGRASGAWQKSIKVPRGTPRHSGIASLYGRLDRSVDRENRRLLQTKRRLDAWDDKFRLEHVDGLMQRLGIALNGNSVDSQGMSFRVAGLRNFPEDVYLLEHLFDAGCPLKRIDVGSIGATDIGGLIRWVEECLRISGLGPPGFLDQLQRVSNRISTTQLTWTSYLVYPVVYLSEYLRGKFGPYELDEHGLWRYLASLFSPVGKFDPSDSPGMLAFLPGLLQGRSLAAIIPNSLTRSSRGIESSGGMYHRTLRIAGLGASPHSGADDSVDLRTVEWLRELVLPLLESQGERILVATTIWGVHEKSPKAFERAERRKIKSNITAYDQISDMVARKEALDQITRDSSQLPFRQSVVMSLAGTSQSQADALYKRVVHWLKERDVLRREVNHPLDHWDNFLTFGPDVRRRDIRVYTAPTPSRTASVSMFRSSVKLSYGMGALVGYYTEHGEPLIIPVGKKGGGNYVATGTTGAGKSMFAKFLVYQLLPLDNRFVFRIMDNTALTLEAQGKARGWKDLVELYGGEVLFADDEQFRDADSKIFIARLAAIRAARSRVVLFTSAPSRPDLDELWLKWLVSDIEVTGPGVVIVDEMVDWFVHAGDERARLWVYSLLNRMVTYNKLSLSTIQSLVPILKEQPGVHGQLLTLTVGGKFAFYDPNEADLPLSLGVPDSVYPRLAAQIRATNRSLKQGEIGPLQRPGFCNLVTLPTGAEVKIESEPEVLGFLGRKDPSLPETLLWGD